MSGREWKPGDVAMVESGCWANRKVALRLAEGWSHENGVNVDGDGVIEVVRPLVVIDPEDREQVGALVVDVQRRLVNQGVPFDIMLGAFTAALREFANPTPPKPDEPMGLGAVVEDADGRLHIRTSGRLVNPWRSEADGTSRSWALVSAVRVLSEGVQP